MVLRPGSQQGEAAQDGAQVRYEQLLELFSAQLGSTGVILQERAERRAMHLFHLMSQAGVVLGALQQLRDSYLWLAGMPLATAAQDLLRDGAEHIISGIESILADEDPRVLDESRWFIELEYLFYDFGRRPEALGHWLQLDPRTRNQQFGFGQTRQREERARGAADGQVLYSRDEYSLHSAAVHPRPSTRGEGSSRDAATGVVYDAIDLLQHSRAAYAAGLEATETISLRYPVEGVWAEPPMSPAILAADEYIAHLNERVGMPPRQGEWVNRADDVGQAALDRLQASPGDDDYRGRVDDTTEVGPAGPT